jgi:hypothetical protein
MTFRYVYNNINKAKNEYNSISNQINHKLNINDVSIYLDQRVNKYIINQLTIVGYRKINRRQVHSILQNKIHFYLVDSVLSFLDEFHRLEVVFDIQYDPFNFSLRSFWILHSINLTGIPDRISGGIQYLLECHNKKIFKNLKEDILEFMIPFCKLIKYA